MHTEWTYKKWIQIIYLVNYIAPSLHDFITTQKRISEKNMRK